MIVIVLSRFFLFRVGSWNATTVTGEGSLHSPKPCYDSGLRRVRYQTVTLETFCSHRKAQQLQCSVKPLETHCSCVSQKLHCLSHTTVAYSQCHHLTQPPSHKYGQLATEGRRTKSSLSWVRIWRFQQGTVVVAERGQWGNSLMSAVRTVGLHYVWM